eukprot:6466030-Amphidinium_carterae.1
MDERALRQIDALASCSFKLSLALDAMCLRASPRQLLSARCTGECHVDQSHRKMVQLASCDWPLACVPLAFGIIITDLWDSFCSWLPRPLLAPAQNAEC